MGTHFSTTVQYFITICFAFSTLRVPLGLRELCFFVYGFDSPAKEECGACVR